MEFFSVADSKLFKIKKYFYHKYYIIYDEFNFSLLIQLLTMKIIYVVNNFITKIFFYCSDSYFHTSLHTLSHSHTPQFSAIFFFLHLSLLPL